MGPLRRLRELLRKLFSDGKIVASKFSLIIWGNVRDSRINIGIPLSEVRKIEKELANRFVREHGFPLETIFKAFERAGYKAKDLERISALDVENELNGIVHELVRLRSQNEQLRNDRPDLASYVSRVDAFMREGELEQAATTLNRAYQQAPSVVLRPSPVRSFVASDDHWIPLTDLMTGLMMIFMLIAISWAIQHEKQLSDEKGSSYRAGVIANKIKRITGIYVFTRATILAELRREFEKDLQKWNAELSPDLTILFKNPEVLFDIQSSQLRPKFKQILEDFFPRYIRILDRFRDSIEEIRIEGHTSSNWTAETSPIGSYLKNMALSQDRTRAVLRHVIELPEILPFQQWVIRYLTANGLSSSKLRKNTDGSEDSEGSRRVEFRIRTNADDKIQEILEATDQQIH